MSCALHDADTDADVYIGAMGSLERPANRLEGSARMRNRSEENARVQNACSMRTWMDRGVYTIQ